MYKRIIFALFIIMASRSAYAETVNRIVAVVNDEAITQSELDVLLVPLYKQYRSVYSGDEFVTKMNEARSNLLNQLIEDRLVAQEAKRIGVKVSEDEIEVQVEEVKKKFVSEEAFNDFLFQQNITIDKLYKRYEEQIAIRKLHQYEVRQKVVVSPGELETYYEEHLDDFTEKEKLKVRTILIKKKRGEESIVDEAKKKMDIVVEELKKGVSFAELARQYSGGTHAAEGGELGFITKGELIPQFDAVLFGLSVGERSPILETDIGFHIFSIDAKQEKKVKELPQVKEEIRDRIFRFKSKERFKTWMNELKENAYISIK
ncbi:MAG: peptidylprolyl isomerase [Candidatus Omnitrophica bacterium]|nr:peptidylprolyl isomerase [Candidatus Omnitrophota bacterium]